MHLPLKRFRVAEDTDVRLKDWPTEVKPFYKSKDDYHALLAQQVEALSEQQTRLYADDRHSLLVIFQSMDAAGKDGAIKHVMSGVNPQGCQVFSFKHPSPEELDHDFLWRTTRCLPERGRIGIFNRSYYEEVLIVRVHPQVLDAQRLPPQVLTRHVWQERFEAINAHELHLQRSGVVVRKFFLHVSKKKQKQRFLERLDTPDKNWKFSANDVLERKHWDDYMAAYEEMIQHTATAVAPWYVVPADHKWFTRLVVAEAVVEALAALDLQWPTVDRTKRKELEVARAELERER
jgi:PPK2 family polyphosphate:nucleotide phosphotransferase